MNIGGLFKSLINPATLMQLAMGPAGWASIALKSIMTAVGSQLIQQLGQRLGLPQSVISMAQTAFSGAMGGSGGVPRSISEAVSQFAQQGGLSASDEGSLIRASDMTIKGLLKKMEAEAEAAVEAAKEKKNGGKVSVAEELNIKGGFLVALAEAIGKVMDQKSDDIVKLANQMNSDGQKVRGKKLESGDNIAESSRLQQQSSLLQGLSQELNTLSQALSTSLKAIGEGQQTLARKN
jgi:hypothetical protein